MPEHRIEPSSSDDDILGLEPETAKSPHPALSRAPDPSMVRDAAKPMPCSNCGYDLRGLIRPVCPECGEKVSMGSRSRAAAALSSPSQSVWFDRKAAIWGAVGLAVGLAVTMSQLGAVAGGLTFGVNFVVTIAIGWVVFVVCSMAWIGFDQPLRMTAFQLAGAYGAYAGASSLASLVPLLWWLAQIAAWLGLIALLAELLDIEFKDGLVIALISGIIKIMLVTWIMTVMMSP